MANIKPTAKDIEVAHWVLPNISELVGETTFREVVAAVAMMRAEHRHAIADKFGELPFPNVGKGAMYIRGLDNV